MNGKLKATYNPEENLLLLQRVYGEGVADGGSWGYMFSPGEAEVVQEAIRKGLGLQEEEGE